MPHPPFLIMKLPLIALALWLAWRTFIKRRPITAVAFPWSILRWLLVIALLGLAACSHTEKLAEANGPLFPLNPDHWQAAPDDLKEPPAAGR